MTEYNVLPVQPTNEIAPSSWANQVRQNQIHFREVRRYYVAQVFPVTGGNETGNKKHVFDIPSQMDGMNLVEVAAFVMTAGTTGTVDIQIRNATKAQDMLSTVLTIDSGDTHSDDAAVPAVIDTTKDDVSESNRIQIDVDGIHTTPALGLVVRLGFAHP